MTQTTQTTAERIADLLDGDGQRWETDDGRTFGELVEAERPAVSYARTGWDDETDTHWVETVDCGEACALDLVRYEFRDGSAIVAQPGAWDIEGSKPFSWRGAE